MLIPGDEEFISLHASSLLAQKKYDEIYIWLDKSSPKIKDQSRLLQTKANAQYRQSTTGKFDEAKRKLSFETFSKAIKISPNSVDANYLYGSYLNYNKRFAEAYPLLKKAAALLPKVTHSPGIVERDSGRTNRQIRRTKKNGSHCRYE